MIRFQSFLSGSSGNSTFLTDGEIKILVDCGANGKYITECLNRIDVYPDEIDAILISHSHRDHVSGAGVISRKYDIPIYTSEETWNDMTRIIGKIPDSNTKVINGGEQFLLGNIKIIPFSTPHDAGGSVGYRFETEKSKVAIATDIGHISYELYENLAGCDCVIIEANHDINMLKDGSYPYYLKRRILSDKGHLSNADAAKLCVMLAKSGTKSLWLGHLSHENNTPDLAYMTVRKALEGEGLRIGSDVALNVLPRFWVE
ncbi:MAG: MBL fold metallo-hydrolase [Ruminococcaceae bacterium]|nr:MBL fold metallo-hydrolase [Oscillospiraceae bacterium]